MLASTGEGDLVFDPFCGSGTTGVAAKELGFTELVGRSIGAAVRGEALRELGFVDRG